MPLGQKVTSLDHGDRLNFTSGLGLHQSSESSASYVRQNFIIIFSNRTENLMVDDSSQDNFLSVSYASYPVISSSNNLAICLIVASSAAYKIGYLLLIL